MKKIIFGLVVALAITTTAWAQNYVAHEVTGRVERNIGGDRWEAVTTGETLRADTVIRTVIGSNLTVRQGDQVLTVGPMRNGRLAEIANSGAPIQIQGRVSQTDTSSANRTSNRLSTASARASDAAGDIELVE